MDRESVEAYLELEFPELLTDIGMTDLTSVLDQTEAVFTANTDLDASWQYAIADYYLLKRARNYYMLNFDISDEDGSYKLSQQYKALNDRFLEAWKKVQWVVEPENPDDGEPGKVVLVTTPYLTPECPGVTGW